jgi:hypothetical protein
MKTTCPSCGPVSIPTGSGICPTCGLSLASPVLVTRTRIEPAARPRRTPVELHLATTIDRTGSSRCFAEGIPKTFEAIVGRLAGRLGSIRCTCQSHGDMDPDQGGQMPTLLVQAGAAAEAIAAVRGVSYGGGGDPEEHHLDACRQLLETVPWSANRALSRGALLLFATADSKPLQSGESPETLGERFKRAGILVYLVIEGGPLLERFAASASGLILPISNDPAPKELERIAAQLVASITCSINQGSTVPLAMLPGEG